MPNGHQPDDLLSPLFEILAADIKAMPSPGQQVIRRSPGPGISTPLAGQLLGGPAGVLLGSTFDAFISELFGLTEPQARAQEALRPEARALDVTDPAVDPGDIQLNTYEKTLRRLRYLGRAMKGSAISPTGIPTSVGVERLVLEGELAPPKDEKDQAILAMAPLLTSLGVFAPLGIGASIPVGLTRAGAISATKIGTSFLGGVATDVGLGAAFGVSEALSRGELADVTGAEPPTGGEVAEEAALFGAGGGAIGLGIRGVAKGGIALLGLAAKALSRRFPASPKSQSQTAAMLEAAQEGNLPSFIPGPGAIIGNKKAVMTTRGLRWQWAEGENRGKWATAPSEVEQREAAQEILKRVQDQMAQTPEGQTAETAAKTATPDIPETLPPDLQGKWQSMQTMGALYYRHEAGKLHNILRSSVIGKEVLTREAQKLREMMVDLTLPEAERLTAGGRMMALERVLGELQVVPGQVPFEYEAFALELVRKVKPTFGRQAVIDEADRLANAGYPELGDRIRALVDSDLPAAVHDAVTKRLRRVSRLSNRGFKRGTRGIVAGDLVEITNSPEYGLAQVRSLTNKSPVPQYVDVGEILPFPKAGETVKLQDGAYLRVTTTQPENSLFGGLDMATGKSRSINPAEIVEVGASPTTRVYHEWIENYAMKLRAEAEDALSIPPIDATTPQGEPITVEAVGAKTAKVRTKAGRLKTVPREEVQRSTATKPESPLAAGEAALTDLERIQVEGRAARIQPPREIVNFAPRTTPDPGHKILFFTVSQEQVPAFELATQQGDFSAFPSKTKFGALAHVLPPMDYLGENIRLYAMEVPAELIPLKDYTQLAKRAVQALQGKTTVEMYQSPVNLTPAALAQARFYRVPEELMRTATQPAMALTQMSQAEQTAYLRHLIVYNEAVESEMASAAVRTQKAKAKGAKAVRQKDGTKLVEAEAEIAQNTVEALQARLQSEISAMDEITADVEAAVAQTDKTMPMRKAFERQGLTPETQKFWFQRMEDLAAVDVGATPDRFFILHSGENPGARLHIVKRARPSTVRQPGGALQPTVETYYELTPISQEGQLLREAVQELPTPQAVTAHVVEQGYVPTLHEVYSIDLVHSAKPSLVMGLGKVDKSKGVALSAEIRPTPTGGTALRVLQRTEQPRVQAEGGLTPEQQKIYAMIGELEGEVESGVTVIREVSFREFNSAEEALAVARTEGFRVVTEEAKFDLSGARRFGQLPPINTLLDVIGGRRTATLRGTRIRRQAGEIVGREPFERTVDAREMLDEIEQSLKGIIKSQQRHGPVTEPVADYTAQFADIYEQVLGRPPFDKETRLGLGFPTLRDLGPSEAKSIDYTQVLLPNTQFKKGRGGPTPVYEAVGDQPGSVVEPGKEFDIIPVMHSSHTPLPKTPPDATVLYTRMIGVKTGATTGLTQLAKAAEKTALQNKWSQTIARGRGTAEPTPYQFSPSNLDVGRYKTTGQVVQIIGASADGKEVRIKFPGTGDEMTVAQNLVEPSKFQSVDRYDHALAGLVVEGRYNQYFQREPPIGYGELENKLGVLGVTDGQILTQTFANRAFELSAQLNKVKEGFAEGPPEVINELLDLFRRSQYLKRELPPELLKKGAQPLDVEAEVLNAVRAVDPKLEQPFRYAAYRRARAEYGDTPTGDLKAQVESGLLEKSPEGKKILAELEKARTELHQKVGTSAGMPLFRVIDELAVRGMIDPNVARFRQALNSEMGFLRWTQDLNLPPTVKISFPQTKDISWSVNGTNLNIPWKMFRRHPHTLIADNLVRAAQDTEIRMNGAIKELTADLTHNGKYSLEFQSEDSMALWKAVTTHDTWGQAAKAGVPEKYRYGYERLGRWMDERMEDLIRWMLLRKIQPVPVDLQAIKSARAAGQIHPMEIELQRRGIDPDNIMDGFALLSRDRNEVLGLTGEVPSGFLHDEIETFLSLRRQFPDAKSLPEGTDPRFREVFDFWKRYGRKNFWPVVHEGQYAVTVERGGQQVFAAWAPSYYDAVLSWRELVKQGRIGAAEDVKVIVHEQVADDILARSGIRSNREWRQLMNGFAEGVKVDFDQTKALFLKLDGVTPERLPAGGLVHAKPRVRGEQPPFFDPMRSLAVYNARVARAIYRFKISEAWRLLHDRDFGRSVAEAQGAQPLWEMPELFRAAEDYMRRAIGEYGTPEKVADIVWRFIRWGHEAPREFFQWTRGKADLPLATILNPKTYHRRFAARAAASDIIGWQSAWRLAGSVGSAFANSMQFLSTTFARMLEEGVPVTQAGGEAFSAWIDAVQLWYSLAFRKPIPKHLQELAPLIDRVGVQLMPAKQMAGAGSFGELTGSIPLGAGQTKFEHWGNMVKWGAMIGFNGAEYTNRYATALVFLRRRLAQFKTEGVPLEVAQGRAVQEAKQMVRETQFLYDELSIPSAMANLGPIGRIVFQFKPFLINFLSFEKDLILAAARGKPAAGRQLAAHFGVLSVLGGGVGLMAHPLLSYAGDLVKRITGRDQLSLLGMDIPLTPEALEAKIAEERLAYATPEQMFTNTVPYRWDDAIWYGLPGLAHLSLGRRVGVSGQDLMMTFDMPGILGPHLSMYAEYFKAWKRFAETPGAGPGIAGGLVGAAVAQQIFRGRAGGDPVRFSGLFGSLAGASLASMGSPNKFAEYLNTSEEGRTFLARGIQTGVRNAIRTWELFDTGAVTDMDGKPQHIPAANRTEELIALAFGLPTIRREEYQSLIGLEIGQSARYENAREVFVDRIAQAVRDGNMEEAMQAAMDANALGVYVPESAIQQRLETLTQESLQTVQQRQSVITRY